MPFNPETFLFIGDTYAIGAAFLIASGIGAGGLWYLWNRHVRYGPSETHLVARNLAEAEAIAAAQPGGRADIVDTGKGKYEIPGSRVYMQPSDGSQPRMPE